MDRYLFRGQIKNEDELWRTGGLYCEGGLDWESSNWYIINSSLREYEVRYKTIGQCTGLKDKNGNLIFEGDIVEQTTNYYKLGKKEPVDTYVRRGRVRWDDESTREAGHWEVATIDYFGNQTKSLLYVGYKGWEVIGNIHDNPELLEVSKNGT